jgi:hypothetical protein
LDDLNVMDVDGLRLIASLDVKLLGVAGFYGPGYLAAIRQGDDIAEQPDVGQQAEMPQEEQQDSSHNHTLDSRLTEKYLSDVDGLHAPLLMHLGEEDEFISKAAQSAIKAALANKPNTTVYSYPGQCHAFSRHGGAHLQCHGGCARQRADKRISTSTPAVTSEAPAAPN